MSIKLYCYIIIKKLKIHTAIIIIIIKNYYYYYYYYYYY